MSNALTKVFIFAAGAVIGSVAAYKYAEAKYKAIADGEIASVKEAFLKKDSERRKQIEEIRDMLSDKKDTTEVSEEDQNEYADIIKDRYSGVDEDGEEVENVDEPYVISPEDFEEGDYNVQSLTYYADGVLTDDWDEIVDIDDTVGRDSLNHFGEYEEDSVFVRNDAKEIDYEILRDTRRYSDI